MKITTAYVRTRPDVAAHFAALKIGRVLASTVNGAPGESSALGTGVMTIARSGSTGWGPPS